MKCFGQVPGIFSFWACGAKRCNLFTSGFPEYFRFHFSQSSVVFSFMLSRVKEGFPKKVNTNDRSKITLLM